MNISPTKVLPAALPPSVVGGGNAPSKGPASVDPFGNFIAQLSGSGGSPAAGQTSTEDSARTSRARGVAGTDENLEGGTPATDDGSGLAAIAVTVPAWLWAVPNQPMIVAQSPDGLAVVPGEYPSTRPGDVNAPGLFGIAAKLSPGMPGGQPATPSIQTDSSSASTEATGALGVVAAGVTTGASASGPDSTQPAHADAALAGSAGIELSKNPTSAATSQTATPGNGTDIPAELSAALPASANQPGSTVSTVQTSRAGRVPVAYGDTQAISAKAAEPTGDRGPVSGAAPDPNAVAAARTAFSPGTLAPSARMTDHVRPADGAAVGGASVSSPVAESQSPLAAALMSSRAQHGNTHSQGEQDSEPAFADHRALPTDVQMPAVQAFDGAVASTLLHADHANAIATGQSLGQAVSVEKTALASEVLAMAGGADRSAGIDSANLHRQMVKAIQLQSHHGIGDARLTLRPEYLGDVTIALRVENGSVTAHVSASASDVRAWLSANEALLRQGLSEQGLTLQRLIVSDEPAESPRDGKEGQARQQQPQPEDQPRSRPRPRHETSTFEITV